MGCITLEGEHVLLLEGQDLLLLASAVDLDDALETQFVFVHADLQQTLFRRPFILLFLLPFLP